MPVAATVDLSKAAIRERAVHFAKRWEGTKSEAAEKQTFWNELLGVFGIDRRQVAAFEELAKRASTGNIGWIDLLYPGQMAVEHKSAGEDLDKALGQLLDYLPALHKAEFPWLLVVSDFERFAWRNLDTGQSGQFALAELPHNLEVFWWMAGHGASPFTFEDEEEANLVATGHMAELYDQLLASGYDAHALREWLTRVLFCLFADDTDVWDRAGFHTYVARYTHEDGHDLGPMLAQLFEVLDTPPERRARTLDEDLAAFTYINGDLFANRLPMPSCNESVRNALLEACRFDWSIISPAIFGSMFQNVMQPRERRQLGAHYTTEQNILRTIRPLFLDDLGAELAAANTRPKLERFLEKLPTLRFMDPACGCGNFLVIAYREVRRLETEALRRLEAQRRRTGQRTMTLELLCKVNVAQFFGIEIEEFPARIARTALYLADHIANREISAEFGELFVRFPIPASPHIVIGNALRMDWNDVLPRERLFACFGNPPYVGTRLQTADQKSDQRLVWGGAARSALNDYVTNWFVLASRYLAGSDGRAAFVATNSITQGEQAGALRREMKKSGVEILFAHRTFAWNNEARGQASVHVVIIGFTTARISGKRRLFVYDELGSLPKEAQASFINAYLVDGPDVVVDPRRSPWAVDTPEMKSGNKPRDGGYLSDLSNEEAETIRESDPIAAKYLRRVYGSREHLQGDVRWCLWLVSAEPGELRSSPELRGRIQKVRDERTGAASSKGEAASYPSLFADRRQPENGFLLVPSVSSETRNYVPMAFYNADDIVTNAVFTISGASLYIFGVLSSRIFTAWVDSVSSRMKSDYQISSTFLYNTFPWPDSTEPQRLAVGIAAQAVLVARDAHPGASLADLYDPLAMPADLVRAHDQLDRVVDSVFAPRRRFDSSADRLALLFERYQQLAKAGTLGSSEPRPTRRSHSS
ncbi:MAG: DNA methyltransferase [Acidimicrobiales bacterium]|jgi:hypothetical protein